MNGKKKVGLVLGRFQPLHPGHEYLIQTAIDQNDIIIICIGSAQIAEPLHITERVKRIEKYIGSISTDKEIRIVELIDPQPISIWPAYVVENCHITSETENHFYRGDELSKEDKEALLALGFILHKVPRIKFNYIAPDLQEYEVSSATEIKEIHKRYNLKI